MTTEKVWRQFKDDLYGFILSRVKNASVAEDILQDVFVKIHLHLGELRSEHKLSSWLYQITRNAVMDYFRKSKPTSEVFDMPENESETGTYQDFEKCIGVFLKALPVKYRDAIEKTELGTMSQKEYALKLGISYSGTKSRVQRAKNELLDLFVACCAIKSASTSKVSFKDAEDCAC